jgi:hypothetical protein
MRELLEPIVGESGALIAQLVLTGAVVLALIAIVYWLVRRFGAMRIGGIGRTRVPRLALVDALAIDSRRRLLLVRRDSVEHLVLIGGPTDLVVEPQIVRARQKAVAPQVTAVPSQPQAVPTPLPAAPAAVALQHHARPPRYSENDAGGTPIPFPAQRTNAVRPSEAVNASFHPFQRVPATPNGANPDEAPSLAPAIEVESAYAPLRASDFDRPLASAGDRPAARWSDSGITDGGALQTPAARGAHDRASAAYDGGQSALAVAPDTRLSAPPRRLDDPDISGLEAEMARLLGEIAPSRSSS